MKSPAPHCCAAVALLSLACTGGLDSKPAGAQAGGASSQGGAAGAPSATPACVGPEVAVPKRLVRLTFNQQATSLSRLFGPELAQTIVTSFEIQDPTKRTFPPLASPREGAVLTDSQWQTSDNIAQAVAQHVFEQFATVTACTDAASSECGQAFVLDLAARAFRRPLRDPERARLLQVYSGVQLDGGSVKDAVRYGVYAVLEAPQYLYRTELGDAPTSEGPLTVTELADAMSFFLSDGPPDAELAAAAASGALATPQGIDSELARLLSLDSVKRNLEAAIFSYFSLADLEHVVIDPAKFPEFTPDLRHSMYREAQSFIQSALWAGPLSQLLTSTTSTIDQHLASIYGIAFPPPGTTPDAQGFVTVTLPETRSGLLTLPAFLTARSRPDHPSVVGRGLAVNAALLCVTNPPFPESLSGLIATANMALASASEREKADYRISTAPCSGCHMGFDPYGLTLENFDSIGRYRTTDEQGRPIDASVTLPANAGGALVPNAKAMSEALATTDAFRLCMTKNLLTYALAEGSGDIDSCSTVAVAEKLRQSDGSFSSLVREIIHAKAFAVRSAGTAP